MGCHVWSYQNQITILLGRILLQKETSTPKCICIFGDESSILGCCPYRDPYGSHLIDISQTINNLVVLIDLGIRWCLSPFDFGSFELFLCSMLVFWLIVFLFFDNFFSFSLNCKLPRIFVKSGSLKLELNK